MDTLPESQIDDITRLAATICGVPIALVGLIDRDRQWYKSAQGLDGTEAPRDLTFCSHAILSPDTMIVEDALLDVRFHDNPYVTGDPPVRFYAGTPLVVATGECIGTLCVIDREPRTLSAQQIDALRTLARHVVTYLELRRKSMELARSERQLQLVVDGSSDGYWDWNVVTGAIHYSGRWASILGYEPGEVVPHIRSAVGLIHPDDIAEVRRVMDEHLQGRRAQYETVHRVRTKSGEWKWVHDRGKVVTRDDDGTPLRMTGTHTDIDERKRAEEMLDRFFHLSLDLLCVAGMDGRFKLLNPAFTEVLGYTEEELLTRPFIDLVHPDDREATLAEMRKLSDGRPTIRFENRYLHRDGSIRWIAWTASPVAESGLIYAAARDITDAKVAAQALHASESAMRSIIGSSLSGIVTFSREGLIASVNPAAEKILGYSEAELLGRDISGLLPEPPADLRTFVRTSVDYSLGRITEWDLRRGDGAIVPVEMALFEFETAEGKHLACNLHDVSERREVETEARVRPRLATSCARPSPPSAAPSTSSPAESSARSHPRPRKSRPSPTATPPPHPTDQRHPGPRPPRQRKDARWTSQHRRRDDLGTAAESVRAFAAQSAVEIVVTASDDALRADADRIVQVLVNLLSNAIKFSPRDSSVRLTARRERGDIVFEVQDHGRGIPRQYLDRIFDRFQQVESSDSRTKGGSGLGLAICKGIIEQHEGSIGVVSEEGSGSTFTVRLPLAPHALGGPVIGVFSTERSSSGSSDDRAYSSPRSSEAPEALRGTRVIATLRRQGYEVVALQTVRQVRTAIENRSISLLIVDANGAAAELPGRLRTLREQHDVPVFVIAPASSSTEWIAESMSVFVPDASQSSLLEAIRGCIARGAAQSDVLIVEDDAELLSVLQKQLERDGIAVRAVAGGREALAMIRAARPRLIVLDVGLPDIDGFDLVAILRSDETLRALPLLVYTGRYLDGADRARLTLGPTRFLTKSTSDDREFRRLVGELIRPVQVDIQGEVPS